MKYKKLLVFFAAAGLIVLGTIAKAESENSGEGSEHSPRPLMDMHVNMEAKMGARMEDRQALLKQRQEARVAFEAKLKIDRDTFKAEVDKEKADFKAAGEARRKEFWTHVGDMVGKRFTEVISKLENAQVKLAVTIGGMDDEDSADAQDDLDLSKQKLADAKVKIAHIKTLLPSDGTKITPEIFASIKLDARDAKDLLKESKEALLSAIKEVREIKVEAHASADTHKEDEDGDGDGDNQ